MAIVDLVRPLMVTGSEECMDLPIGCNKGNGGESVSVFPSDSFLHAAAEVPEPRACEAMSMHHAWRKVVVAQAKEICPWQRALPAPGPASV